MAKLNSKKKRKYVLGVNEEKRFKELASGGLFTFM